MNAALLAGAFLVGMYSGWECHRWFIRKIYQTIFKLQKRVKGRK